MRSKTIDLYGGAILSKLGDDYLDASNVREIPDHQEVFLHRDNDNSIIVELLEMDSNTDDETAIVEHFNDIASHNEASFSKVVSFMSFPGSDNSRFTNAYRGNEMEEVLFVPSLKDNCRKLSLIGKQVAGKFRQASVNNKKDVDEIIIILVLLRLINVNTDLLVSLNMPIASSQSEEIDQLLSPKLLLPEYVNDDAAPHEALPQHISSGISTLRTFVNCIDVKNWSLFIN